MDGHFPIRMKSNVVEAAVCGQDLVLRTDRFLYQLSLIHIWMEMLSSTRSFMIRNWRRFASRS